MLVASCVYAMGKYDYLDLFILGPTDDTPASKRSKLDQS